MTMVKFITSISPRIRYVISTGAVFVALWALIAMMITAIWNLFQIGDQRLLHDIRWVVSLGILMYLIKRGNILINK